MNSFFPLILCLVVFVVFAIYHFANEKKAYDKALKFYLYFFIVFTILFFAVAFADDWQQIQNGYITYWHTFKINIPWWFINFSIFSVFYWLIASVIIVIFHKIIKPKIQSKNKNT